MTSAEFFLFPRQSRVEILGIHKYQVKKTNSVLVSTTTKWQYHGRKIVLAKVRESDILHKLQIATMN